MKNVPKAIVILWMSVLIILGMPHGMVFATTGAIQQPASITGWEVKWGTLTIKGS